MLPKQDSTLLLTKDEETLLSHRKYTHHPEVLLSNFYLYDANHRPIHCYKLTPSPKCPIPLLLPEIHPYLKEVLDFYVFLGEPLEIKHKRLSPHAFYSFNDSSVKHKWPLVVNGKEIEVVFEKVKKNLVLTYERNKAHFLKVYNELFRKLVSFSEYQILKTPFMWSNEGLFYVTNEKIKNPDEIWQILKETVKQVREREGRHEEEKAKGKVQCDEDELYEYEDDEEEEEEFRAEEDLLDKTKIFQGSFNLSIRKKNTYLKKIRESEDVYRGWEYQLKVVEKGLGIFLHPVYIRKNRDTVHEFCTELADILLYQTEENKDIKKLEEMLIGKVVLYINDKDRAYQIISVNRAHCDPLPQGSNLYDEYEEEYLDNIRVDLKEWLGRPVLLTDLEERKVQKDISLKEISEVYHNLICKEMNPQTLLTLNHRILRYINSIALKNMSIFDCYEVFLCKPWKIVGKYLENPLIDISKKGKRAVRDQRYLEYSRSLDQDVLEHEINFPPPMNNWELYCSEDETAEFFLSMLDKVCYPKEIRQVEVPTVFKIEQIREFEDSKWEAFVETNRKKPNITDICSMVNLQRREWELKFEEIRMCREQDTSSNPSVAVVILSMKEEDLDNMYLKACSNGKTIERSIREHFIYKTGIPVVFLRMGSDICDSGSPDEIMRDFRRIYLKMVMACHGTLWSLKEIPLADTLTMAVSLSVKKVAEETLFLGLFCSFDRHFDKFWTKQSIVSKDFLIKYNEQKKNRKMKATKRKGKKDKGKREKTSKGKNDIDEELSFQTFFELKLANMFGKTIIEFKDRVCKFPVNIVLFINEERCYYGSLYDKIFRNVAKKFSCNSHLIVVKSEKANLEKNKMFFFYCRTVRDIGGDTFKFSPEMGYPGFCIDKDLVLPVSDKVKAMKNKKYHQFYLNPICGDINESVEGCHIRKYSGDNMRLYKVVQYASEYTDQYRFINPEDIQVFVYWMHFLNYTTVLTKNKYNKSVRIGKYSEEGINYISRLPMMVEYSDALIEGFEAGKFVDWKFKNLLLSKKMYEKELKGYDEPPEIRMINPKIRSLATLLSIT